MITSLGRNMAKTSPVKKFHTGREGIMAMTFLFIALILYVVHFAFFRYSYPLSNLDDATFLSPAYNLAVHGTFATDIHASFLPGAGQYTYWMPPLYMFLLAGVLKAFGLTMLNAQLFSFLLILLSAGLISLVSKDKYVRLILVGLWLICPFVVIASARLRMEPLGLLIICCSMLAVQRKWPAYITGIIAALGFMTHPMVYGCCAGLAFYNLRKGIKPFLMFALTGLIVVIPHLLYIFQDISMFREQMNFQLSRKSAATLDKIELSYILQFVPISLAALLFLYLTKKERDLKIFLSVSLILTLFVILRSREFNYHVYTIPYILAALAMFLEERKEAYIRLLIPALFFAFFSMTLLLKAYKYNNFQRDSTYYELTEFLSNDRTWSGKTIYVAGPYDISTFLILNHQKVERVNAAFLPVEEWTKKFNYVIAVVEKGKEKEQLKENRFWKEWNKQESFTTSDGRYTLYTAQQVSP